jgi:hypothetical protein
MMLSKSNPIQRDQLELVALDQLIPQEHLVPKMEEALADLTAFLFTPSIKYCIKNCIKKSGKISTTKRRAHY